MSLLFSLPELYLSYKNWVSSNPQFVGDVESTVKWVSYFIAGRIYTSNAITELVYSLSNLLVLFNDTIIRKSLQGDIPKEAADTLKLWLTTLEYCEVFIELSAKQLWGRFGKWSFVVMLQLFKCIGRLVLLYHYKVEVVQSPPIPFLQRKKAVEKSKNPTIEDGNPVSQASLTITLNRSNRVLRKIEAAPPKCLRNWKPPIVHNPVKIDTVQPSLVLAETMYVLKPIIHLGATACFGSGAWKSWLLSLGIDVTSLHMFYTVQKNHPGCLSRNYRLELSRRCVSLLLYLLRSPFFDRYTKKRLQAFLRAIGKNIPLANNLVGPMLMYLPHWQETYFYMWST